MSDQADIAARLQQLEIDASMTRREPIPDLPYTGNCHWCDAPVGERNRWCDADCRDEWERDWIRRQQR